MDLILVPGLWLDASSWDAVVPGLVAAGHRPHPVTLPGVGAPAAESDSLTIDDWVAATVTQIDALDGPVVLVGHSGGGNVVWGAADARPDKVSRVILVDTAVPPPGAMISEFAVVDGVIPFPGWDFFDEEEVHDLTPEVRERAAKDTFSVPVQVPTGPISLTDERRYDVPVTVLSGGMDEEQFRAALAQWGAFADEAAAVKALDVVTIGSGHWPQFSVPERLTGLIAEAAAR
ncbi:alpha/beta fold hydrolase [Arthrobacter sp. RAF14]|uniref:alpha/beta fold hydrolase n=1 Tax=Arthrobacter sp. RAF14 TaxID=3233051 RepID=UPI003F9053C0